jgi:hypothetical protein
MCMLCQNTQTLQLAEVAAQLSGILFPGIEELAAAREEYASAKAQVDETLKGLTAEGVREALADDANQPALQNIVDAAKALVRAMDDAAGEAPAPEPIAEC